MRLALLSDIHGNPIALDAVLADIEQAGGVDGHWILGDVVALGFDPVGALERVTALADAEFLRGNTDRYTITGELPLARVTNVEADPRLFDQAIEMAASFAWTRGYLTSAGLLDWLDDLPLELRRELPDGTRLLGVHASPGRDDGPGIGENVPDGELRAAARAAETDIVCVGHTHLAYDRTVDGVRLFNLGSVSNPPPGEANASYALLEADENGYELVHRRVPYDHDAVVEAVRRTRHPGAAFILRHYGA